MNHRHFKKILISNNIIPKTFTETKTALKLVQQKEKFILEDASKALVHNKKIQPLNSMYTLEQFIHQVYQITNRYYALYIQISQFEAFLRTYVNHKMVKVYGNKWHMHKVMHDLDDFKKQEMSKLEKPSQALNSISFGTLELVFLNGSRYMSVFESGIKKEKILSKDNKPKYNNKREIKSIFSIIRNARNDICHHRRIGASIRANQKYTKHKMTLSDVTRALKDLKTLLNYDDRFDVQGIELKYKNFNKGK